MIFPSDEPMAKSDNSDDIAIAVTTLFMDFYSVTSGSANRLISFIKREGRRRTCSPDNRY